MILEVEGTGRQSSSTITNTLVPGGKRVYVLYKSLQYHSSSPAGLGQPANNPVKCGESFGLTYDQVEKIVLGCSRRLARH